MKILFFDYWLKGIANFNRLMPELKKQCPNAEVKMIHVGSWKEKQESIVNKHDGFYSYDISYYHTWSILKVLKQESPDVLVMLNLCFLFDKSLIIFCRYLGIKTVYLAHGKFLANTEELLGSFVKQDLKKNFFSKIRIDTINILRNYLLATIVEQRPITFVKSMIAMLRNPLSMTLNSTYTDELDADCKLVYYENDKLIMMQQRKFPDKNIYVVGNPELDAFVNNPLLSKDNFIQQTGLDSDKPYLLYLDDGYVQARLMEKNIWHTHLAEIAEIVQKVNMQLVIKLHPRTPLSEHADFFISKGIVPFSKEVDFKSLIAYSYAVTSLASTTISFALLLNKRVITPRWGATKGIIHNYPDNVIHYSESMSDFADWLINNKPCNTSTDYITNNIGIVDGQAIPRVVAYILKH